MSQQINLYNPDFRKKRVLFSSLMLLQGLAVLLAVLAGTYGYQYRQTQSLAKQTKDGELQLEQARAHLKKVAQEFAPHGKNLELQNRVKELEQQLKGEEAVLDVLRSGRLGNTQGYSAYMRAFARQTVSGLWLTGFSIESAGKDIAIAGRTLRPELIPAYIQGLNRETVIEGAGFNALEIEQPKEEATSKDKPALMPNYLEFNLHSKAAEGAK